MATLPIIHGTRLAAGSESPTTELVDLEFSNGERRTYHRLRSGGAGAVIMVPMRDPETLLLVREYAVGMERYELGLPKGRLEKGESPLEGADRELKEELGFGAKRLTLLKTLALSPSYMMHITHVVLAEELYPERLPGDEPEELEVMPWRIDALHELLERDEVTDSRTIATLFLAREYLAGRLAAA